MEPNYSQDDRSVKIVPIKPKPKEKPPIVNNTEIVINEVSDGEPVPKKRGRKPGRPSNPKEVEQRQKNVEKINSNRLKTRLKKEIDVKLKDITLTKLDKVGDILFPTQVKKTAMYKIKTLDSSWRPVVEQKEPEEKINIRPVLKTDSFSFGMKQIVPGVSSNSHFIFT